MNDIFNILLAVFIIFGSISGYIPQFYKIIKYKSVENISEISILIMNIGMMCLTMNSMIFNWKYFVNLNMYKLLPFITIAISWLMVSLYYIIYITYKIKKLEKRLLSAFRYLFTYILFTLLVIALSLGEKMENNIDFFVVYANVLGIFSGIANGFVYIPQIYTLIKNKNNGNISILMYVLQTPGNIINIIFQILYDSPISTWITYAICLIQQSIILVLMMWFYFREMEETEEMETEEMEI
jgi:uncharacterized protein with PQ loop repeat